MKNVWPSVTWGLPLLGVVPACLVGVGIMRRYGSASSMLLTNLVAAILGLLIAAFLSSALVSGIVKRPLLGAALVLAGFTASLFAGGLAGVHRWVRLGPIRFHPVAVAMPILLLAIIVLWERQRKVLAIATIVMSFALLVMQPDAGQATALAAAVIVMAGASGARKSEKLVVVILAALGTLAAWMRPDPLPGMPMVEDIVREAFVMHLGLGVLAVLALASLPGASLGYALVSARHGISRVYGLSLTAYFVASIVVVAFGEFPVPVLGFGASPIIGAMLGLGLLKRISASAMPKDGRART